MHHFTAAFLFAGLGAGARGFLRAVARLKGHEARFKNLGGVDIDPAACRDFEKLTGGKAHVADLATLQPAQLRAMLGPVRPDCAFSSPPCKGYSGLLGKETSETPKYQELNKLVLKGLFLLCETWDEPPPLILIENVPRITSRGARLLEKARALLHSYGYVFNQGYHDCGELGGLAQHRRRFLLIARHQTSIPNFVYEPRKQPLKGCGEVIGPLPFPDDPSAGPLHRLSRLSWINWVRLALIPAGGDWRDLPKDGVFRAPLRDKPDAFHNQLKIVRSDEPVPTVTGAHRPGNGAISIADSRLAIADQDGYSNKRKVLNWRTPSGAVTGSTDIQEGAASIADPRIPLAQTAAGADTFKGRPGLFGVNPWNEPLPTVTGSLAVSASNAVAAVADPRLATPLEPGQKRRAVFARHGVLCWDAPVDTVAGPGTNGVQNVADPRIPLGCTPRENSRAYGVCAWDQPLLAVTGSACIDNGQFAVADPRIPPHYRLFTVQQALAQANGRKSPPKGLVPVIPSPHDGTWHRPVTTLECAALQGLPPLLDGKPLTLDGKNNGDWRERIGNAVPVPTAEAIAEEILKALLAARLGTWTLSSSGIWVRPPTEQALHAA